MRIFSVVAEFNPFHNGHKYLVENARLMGADCVAAVMSGSFVQRGGCAVMNKFARAKAAVLGGVDIVFELPSVFAVSAAEYFAFGGIRTLDVCGCVSDIVFGSECGDIGVLLAAANAVENSERINADIKTHIQAGVSYPRAVYAAAGSADPNVQNALRSPNDTLAVEYLRSLGRLKSTITPHCVRREGAAHDSSDTEGQFASASHIRKMISEGNNDRRRFMPESTAEIVEDELSTQRCPGSLSNNERGVLTVLRSMDAERLCGLPEVSEGIENRIVEAAKKSTSIDELIEMIKCKRYTYARINRIITNACLGTQADLVHGDVGYIRVLAFNSTGREMLRMMKKTAKRPVLLTARDFGKLTGEARRMLMHDIQASDMYALCTPRISPCSSDYYTSALYIR